VGFSAAAFILKTKFVASAAFTCSLSANKGITCGSGSSYRYFYNSQSQASAPQIHLGNNGCIYPIAGMRVLPIQRL
jgi:hypothetical protein